MILNFDQLDSLALSWGLVLLLQDFPVCPVIIIIIINNNIIIILAPFDQYFAQIGASATCREQRAFVSMLPFGVP